MVSLMKSSKGNKRNIKPSSVNQHFTRINDHITSNSKCALDLELSNKNSIKSQEASLHSDYWKDSFDKLVADRSLLRKNNIIKKNVNASYNRDSSNEFSRIFKVNKRHSATKKITKISNNDNCKNYLKPSFKEINGTVVSTPIFKKKIDNDNDLSISISPIKKKYELRKFFKTQKLFEFSKNTTPSFLIELCGDSNNENDVQSNKSYNQHDKGGKQMNKKKGRKKSNNINRMRNNSFEYSKSIRRSNRRKNLKKLQDDDFKESQNKKREIIKLQKIKHNKNENLRSKKENTNVAKLDVYKNIISKVLLQRKISPFRCPVSYEQTNIDPKSTDTHLVKKNFCSESTHSSNTNRTQNALEKSSVILLEKLPSQGFENQSFCVSSLGEKNEILDSPQLNFSNNLKVNSDNSKLLNRSKNQMLSLVLFENSTEVNNSKLFIKRRSSKRREIMGNTMKNCKIKLKKQNNMLYSKELVQKRKPVVKLKKLENLSTKLIHSNLQISLLKSLNVKEDKGNKRIFEKESLGTDLILDKETNQICNKNRYDLRKSINLLLKDQTTKFTKNKRKLRTNGHLLHSNLSRSISNENVSKNCIKCNQCVHKLFNSIEHQYSLKDVTFSEFVSQQHSNLSLLRNRSNASNVTNNADNDSAVKVLSTYNLLYNNKSSYNLSSEMVIDTELSNKQENSREIENRISVLNDITTKVCNTNDDYHEGTKDKDRRFEENNEFSNNENKLNYVTTKRQKIGIYSTYHKKISVLQESRELSRRFSSEISNSSTNCDPKQKNHSSTNYRMNPPKLLLVNNTLNKNNSLAVNASVTTENQNIQILDNITKRKKCPKSVKINDDIHINSIEKIDVNERNVQSQDNDFCLSSAVPLINTTSEQSLEILQTHQKDVVKKKKSMNIVLPSGKWRKSINVWKRRQSIGNDEISNLNRSTSSATTNSQRKIDNSFNNSINEQNKFCRRKITINDPKTIQDILEDENFNQHEEILITNKTSLGVTIKPINNNLTEENRRSRAHRKRSSTASSNNQQNLHNRLSQIRLRKNLFEISFTINEDRISSNKIRKRNSNIQDMVFQLCEQTKPIKFIKEYSKSILQNCRKIGEGVYGEVFMNLQKNLNDEEINNVLKIIPIEGNIIINGERQKKFNEVFSELIIATELSRLKYDKDFMTPCFVDVKKIRCVEGKYPQHLIRLWEQYDEQKNSENDHPEIFPDDQLFIVLELANGGQDLEAFVFDNALQSYSAFLQIAFSLAIAENKFKFEHRDLHWGNILLIKTKEKEITFHFNDKEIKVPTYGVKATIIDYTLSRMIFDDFCFFNDLSNDEELFSASGDYQFDIYRLMRKVLSNNWERFEPYTNILWLHYIIDKMINGVRYRYSKTKKHRSSIEIMMHLRDKLLNHKSACSYINQNFNRNIEKK